jgi:hypothetical protein
MGKWTVTAVNGNIKAKSGNNHPLFIIVSIEDANGAPVQSLTADNFLLAAEVSGGLAFSETFTVSSARLPASMCFRWCHILPDTPGWGACSSSPSRSTRRPPEGRRSVAAC